MLLQIKETKQQFHVPSGVGKSLLASGIVEEVVAVKPVVAAAAKWSATPGASQGAYPPVVRYSCPSCNQSGYQESAIGTAHETARFRHCGRVEICSDEAAENYVALWMQYQTQFVNRGQRPDNSSRFKVQFGR